MWFLLEVTFQYIKFYLEICLVVIVDHDVSKTARVFNPLQSLRRGYKITIVFINFFPHFLQNRIAGELKY